MRPGGARFSGLPALPTVTHQTYRGQANRLGFSGQQSDLRGVLLATVLWLGRVLLCTDCMFSCCRKCPESEDWR